MRKAVISTKLRHKFQQKTASIFHKMMTTQASTQNRSKFVENVQKMLTPNHIDCFKFVLLLLPFDLGIGIFRFLNICISKREETEFFYNVIRSALKYRKGGLISEVIHNLFPSSKR